MNTPCMYCYAPADLCPAEDPHGFVCTRATGHGGDHAACDGDDHPISTWPQRGDTTGEVLARLRATMARLLDEADVELRAQARCPDPDEHVRYDAALAAAEKAERERDEANERAEKHRRAVVDHSTNARCWMQTSEEWQATAEEWEKRARAAEQPRPLTPDAITNEMVERARSAYWGPTYGGSVVGRIRAILTAALTEPPARPEGAERWEDFLIDSLDYQALTDQQITDLADRIAEEMNR